MEAGWLERNMKIYWLAGGERIRRVTGRNNGRCSCYTGDRWGAASERSRRTLRPQRISVGVLWAMRLWRERGQIYWPGWMTENNICSSFYAFLFRGQHLTSNCYRRLSIYFSFLQQIFLRWNYDSHYRGLSNEVTFVRESEVLGRIIINFFI